MFFALPSKSENEVQVDQIIRGVRIHDWAKPRPDGAPSKIEPWLALGSIVIIALTFWRAKPAVASSPEIVAAGPQPRANL